MSLNIYVVGNLVQVDGLFTIVATGEPADPTAVTGEVRLPDQTVVDVTSSITRSDVGAYSFQYEPTTPGLHQYRMAGTGAVIAAEESAFDMQTSFSS